MAVASSSWSAAVLMVLAILIERMIPMTKTKNATKKKKRLGRCFTPIYITVEEVIISDGFDKDGFD